MTETNQNRTPRIQKIIDDKLTNYFTKEQINSLTNEEIDVYNDYFSNQQLRELKNAPEQILKSLVSRHLKTVERQRLTNIPVDELPQMLEYYKEHAQEVEEVVCQKCGNVIAVEILHADYESTKYFNNPNLHWQGRFVIAVGNRLLGYRKRHDDVMGYRCGCFIDNPEFEPAKRKYEQELADYDQRVKDWNTKHEEFAEARDKWERQYGEGREIIKNPDAEKVPVKKGAPKMPVWTGGEKPSYPVPPHMPARIPCGNETTLAPVEVEAVPDDHLAQSVITQADIMKIKQRIDQTDYKKPVKKVKDGYVLDDKFLLRKVK